MTEKSVYIVMCGGFVEGVFDTAEKAEAYICRKYIPEDWTPEQVKQGLDEISDECYYDKWLIE